MPSGAGRHGGGGCAPGGADSLRPRAGHPEKARAFLDAGRGQLLDPFLMKDMDWPRRGAPGAGGGEHIAVYGDYDVDGITSTCLLTDFLRREGDGDPLHPRPDGGGLRPQPGGGAASGARGGPHRHGGLRHHRRGGGGLRCSPGVELVITDHHECKVALPAAAAVVDPAGPTAPIPSSAWPGWGGLKLVLALGDPARRDELLERYADLAAIGTVADVMSLTGENRTIVRLGLEALRRTGRPGLRALLHEAGLDERPLTATAIGYTLAPRINASGRMGCASLAGELLLTDDPARGEELSRALCDLNRERQAIEAEIYTECQAMAEALPQPQRHALVLAGEQWHQGVVGIVASRLAEKYSCPAFMICLQDGKGKGSCRSFAGFNLFAALERCAPLLEGFGGHALAAGFTIREENIPAFAAAMNDYVCACTGGEEMVSALDIDGELDDVGLLTLEGVEGLELLEPYGAGNPKPVFSLSGCLVSAVNEVGGGRHLKLKLTASGRSFDAIFFSATAEEAGVGPGDRVDVAFTPQINEYRGWRSVQLQLCDLRPALTRAQAERALYEKFRRGEPLTRQEAEALLASREEFVTLWRYLKGHAGQAPLEATAHRLARSIARSAGRRETVMRTLVCLEVFDERGLIRLEHTTDHLHIALRSVDGKVNLDDSCIMRKLRHILSNG
ncbi:MAG: single-stranded-DNA-specific exonuclease RecJ [Flavonifractor plautii]